MTSATENDEDQEMSMDEILASIRRYVSSDEPMEKTKPVPRMTAPLAAPTQPSARPSATLTRTPDAAAPSDASLRSAPLHEFLSNAPMVSNSTPPHLSTPGTPADDVVRLQTMKMPQPLSSVYDNNPFNQTKAATQQETATENSHRQAPSTQQAFNTMDTLKSPYQAAPSYATQRQSTFEQTQASAFSRDAHAAAPSARSQQAPDAFAQPAPQPAPQPTEVQNNQTKAHSGSDSLVSDAALSSTLASFSKLNNALQQNLTQQANAQHNTSQPLTLDQVFYDLARPMISQWLEQHLPKMVEEMVTNEIDRITKGVRR